jgi:hypothetical protein
MSIEKIFPQEISKRDLLAAGLGGLAYLAAGCAGAQKNIKNPSEFNVEKFVGWYRRNRLYNKANPNLRRPHSAHNIFVDSFNRWTPGVDYYVPAGEVMVAAAPGIVMYIAEITGTGRLGGLFIHVGHPASEKSEDGRFRFGPYISSYNHVAEPFVQQWQKVERGQPLCRVPVIYSDNAKLYVLENSNWVDPDNYGFNHAYMDYQRGPIEQDKDSSNPDLMTEKLYKQTTLLQRFDKLRKDWETTQTFLSDLWHNKNGYKPSEWSTVEKFRFLETLYQMHPHQFPNLSKEEFESMRKEFYQNQPIILTLPFRKK